MKIPFENTIAGAYRFAFTNILSILGVAWFPFLLFAALIGGLAYLWLPGVPALIAAVASGKPPFSNAQFLSIIGPLVATEFGFLIVYFVVIAMVNVGVMRKALGLQEGPVFVYFSLGGDVWRLIGAYLLLFFLGIGLGIVLSLGVAALSFAASRIIPGFEPVVAVFAIIAAILAFIYAAVRVTFFIPAVVVAENHIGIGRSWSLGGGNFWRIVGIVLIVTLPLGFATNIANSTIMQIVVGPGVAGLQTGASPADAQKLILDILHAMLRFWPAFALVQLVSIVLQVGLSVGAAGTAYNLVTGSARGADKVFA